MSVYDFNLFIELSAMCLLIISPTVCTLTAVSSCILSIKDEFKISFLFHFYFQSLFLFKILLGLGTWLRGILQGPGFILSIISPTKTHSVKKRNQCLEPVTARVGQTTDCVWCALWNSILTRLLSLYTHLDSALQYSYNFGQKSFIGKEKLKVINKTNKILDIKKASPLIILVVGTYAIICKIHTWFSLLVSRIKVLSPLQFPEWQVREVAFALILVIYVFVIHLHKTIENGTRTSGWLCWEGGRPQLQNDRCSCGPVPLNLALCSISYGYSFMHFIMEPNRTWCSSIMGLMLAN